ncbi:MAG TPA: DNA repair exonuclease [Firmicutes bacterium]|nr:DNA repair exonuclease [Bacillota bacterium]
MEIRLLHTADAHLDNPLSGLGKVGNARRKEIARAFERVVSIAIEKGVTALLLAGDLYHDPSARSSPWVKSLFKKLERHGIHVLAIPGNHDELPACKAYMEEFPPNVYIFSGEELTPYTRIEGLSIYGVVSTDKHRRVLKGFRKVDAPGFHIALVHGQYRLTDQFAENYCPIEPEDIELSGLDYIALGHFHNFMDCSHGRTRAFYPGSPARLDFSDIADRVVLLITLNDAAVSVEQVPLEDRQYITVEADINDPDHIHHQVASIEDEAACVRVRLSGITGDPSISSSIVDDLVEKYSDKFFYFCVEDKTDVMIGDLDDDFTIRGKFLQRMRQRVQDARDGEDALRVRYALSYGLAALRGARLK